jgi:hypothetical protein
VLIVFSSNESITASGWILGYQSVKPVWCNNMTVLTEPADTFGDGSGSFYYENGTTCMWKIEPPGISQITINFLDFETEDDNDEVRIYDAGSSQLLATYSGIFEPDDLPPPVTSLSGKMMIAFSSNSSITKQGWTACYSTEVGIGNSSASPNEIRIYPNPFNDFVTIDFKPGALQTYQISVSDLKGQIYFTEKIKIKSGSIKDIIDLSNLQQGVYFINIKGNKSSYIKKIIKITK